MTHQQFPSSPQNAFNPLAPDNDLSAPFFNPKSGHLAHTAPNSPLRLSPINLNITPTNIKGVQPTNKVRLSMPPRAHTEAFDMEKYEQASLFSIRVQTDPGDGDEPNQYQSHVSRRKQHDDLKRKTSLQNLQSLIDDIKKANNKSYSTQKSTKSQKAGSQPPIKWPKEISTISEKGTKNAYKSRKRPQSSNERLNESNGDSTSKSEKKAAKTPIKDLEIDLELDERFATEGEGEGESPDGLFDEMNDREVHSCKNSRDTGPLRYSKMSEEDAASIFEKRRKQLLSFLFKLGANSAVVKKKLFTKKPLMPKQGNFSNNSPDIQKYESILDKEMRSVKDTLRPSASPNTFIIYNNNMTEKPWSGGQARLGTPAKENNKLKRLPSSVKAGSDSASDAKRRNSLKANSEKEEANAVVKRNLESSFNKIAQDWQDSNNGRGFRKIRVKAETFTGSVDEKKDVFENIKIDLKKEVSKKKKKKRTAITQIQVQVQEQEPEHTVNLEKMIQKRTSEDLGLLMNRNRELNEIKEERKVNLELINHMRKKNKAVLSDIEEIDVQIQKMEAERQLKERKKKSMEHMREARGRKDERGRKEESKRVEIHEEFLHESYASAARARRSKERPKSMGFKNSFMEGMKQRKSPWEESSQMTTSQMRESSQMETRNKREHGEGFAKNEERNSTKRKTNSKFTSEAVKINNDRWPRSPQSFHDRNTNDWNVDNDVKNKDKKSHQRSLVRDIPISKIVPASAGIKSPPRSRRNVEDLTIQSLDLGKGMDQNFNLKVTQSATNKKPEKDSQPFGGLRTTLKQQNKKATKEENEKDYRKVQSTASTLHSFRNAGLTNEDLFTLGKSQGSNQEKIRPRVSENSKPTNAPKKVQRNPLITKSRKSLEGDYNPADLFASVTSTKPAKKLPIKISFFDEVKKILKEGCSDEQKTPLSLKERMDSSKSTLKSTKDELQNIKREVINRPKTDTVLSLDIRTKLLKEGRPLEDLKKSSKFLNAPGINNAKSRKELSKKPSMELGPKSQSNLNRKSSETTSQGLDNISFPSNIKAYANNFIDGDSERTDRLLTSERHGIDSSTSITASEKIDRNQIELAGQVNKGPKEIQIKRQAKANLSKDFQAPNRKKM